MRPQGSNSDACPQSNVNPASCDGQQVKCDRKSPPRAAQCEASCSTLPDPGHSITASTALTTIPYVSWEGFYRLSPLLECEPPVGTDSVHLIWNWSCCLERLRHLQLDGNIFSLKECVNECVSTEDIQVSSNPVPTHWESDLGTGLFETLQKSQIMFSRKYKLLGKKKPTATSLLTFTLSSHELAPPSAKSVGPAIYLLEPQMFL